MNKLRTKAKEKDILLSVDFRLELFYKVLIALVFIGVSIILFFVSLLAGIISLVVALILYLCIIKLLDYYLNLNNFIIDDNVVKLEFYFLFYERKLRLRYDMINSVRLINLLGCHHLIITFSDGQLCPRNKVIILGNVLDVDNVYVKLIDLLQTKNNDIDSLLDAITFDKKAQIDNKTNIKDVTNKAEVDNKTNVKDNKKKEENFIIWTCPNCGEKNSPDATNCVNCFTKKV